MDFENEFEKLLASMDMNSHFKKKSDWILNIENKFKTFNSKFI
jgi:hypothetical protein